MITFEPGQTELEYEMEIVDDDEWEPDEEFYVKVWKYGAEPSDDNDNAHLSGNGKNGEKTYWVKIHLGQASTPVQN